MILEQPRGSDGRPDLFVSYSWTTEEHKVWVHQFADHLRAAGFQVLLDAALDYGEPLDAFMRDVAVEARHVLAVVDEAYIEKADQRPDSGVAVETRAFQRAHATREANWLSVVFKDNSRCQLPAWLREINPKGFDFNAEPDERRYPGPAQVEEVWRWLQGLPADKSKAVSLTTLRQRAARIERSKIETSPERWTSPELAGEVEFPFTETPSGTFRLGHGDYLFTLHFSGAPARVYSDYVARIGLLAQDADVTIEAVQRSLTAKRTYYVSAGSRIAVENAAGVLCLVEFTDSRREPRPDQNDLETVSFRWTVFTEEEKLADD